MLAKAPRTTCPFSGSWASSVASVACVREIDISFPLSLLYIFQYLSSRARKPHLPHFDFRGQFVQNRRWVCDWSGIEVSRPVLGEPDASHGSKLHFAARSASSGLKVQPPTSSEWLTGGPQHEDA